MTQYLRDNDPNMVILYIIWSIMVLLLVVAYFYIP